MSGATSPSKASALSDNGSAGEVMEYEKEQFEEAEWVDKWLSKLLSSVLVQCCVIFPVVMLLCYVVGFFQVWVALMAVAIFYTITMHKREREGFHRSYLWTLQSLIDRREELPDSSSHDDLLKGIGGAGETLVLQSLATIWWNTNARSFFQILILEQVVDLLNSTVAAKISVIEKFIAGRVKVSSDPPKLLSVHCSPSSYNSLVSKFEEIVVELHANGYLDTVSGYEVGISQ